MHANTDAERRQFPFSSFEGLGIVGESRALIKTFALAKSAALLHGMPILITGETGTGKELLATAIHQMDPQRSAHPFVPLNCAALTRELFESELFGSRRGSFTGAYNDRRGIVRSTDGGTLFLDEIGELEHALQPKLLRVLQEKRVLSLGEEREVPVNFRVFSATNYPISHLLDGKRLREDLYYRLAGLEICLPPLRDRHGDHQLLVKHFVAKHRDSFKRVERWVIRSDFIEAVERTPLPGNVRELEHLTVRAMVRASSHGGVLSARHLPDVCVDRGGVLRPASDMRERRPELKRLATAFAAYGLEENMHLNELLKTCKQACINEALRRARGKQATAARILDVSPRTIYNHCREIK